MSGKDLQKHCRLADATLELLERAMAHQGLSARAYDRILARGAYDCGFVGGAGNRR